MPLLYSSDMFMDSIIKFNSSDIDFYSPTYFSNLKYTWQLFPVKVKDQ